MTQLDDIFSALSDATRRNILSQLALQETTLSELAEPTSMTQTAVTKHVRVLERIGLVHVKKRGRVRHCSLAQSDGLKTAFLWLQDYQEFWANNLSSLEEHLTSSKAGREQ